jgi:hypothetical protein
VVGGLRVRDSSSRLDGGFDWGAPTATDADDGASAEDARDDGAGRRDARANAGTRARTPKRARGDEEGG